MHRLTALVAALFCGQALGDFVVSPFPMSSGGPLGNATNSVYLYTYTGPDTVIGAGSFTGALLEIETATLASEARWNIRNTRFPASSGVNYQVSFAGNFNGTILIAAESGAGMVLKTGDVLRFETFESFDDSAGVDAVWTDASFTFTDAVVTDLGEALTGLDITTTGGPGPFGTDTEIGVYKSDGTLVGFNDDYGSTSGSGLIDLVLTEGTYYLAVSPYDSLWANAIMGSGIDGIGAYDLRLNGAIVLSDSTVSRAMDWFKLTVPAPCACPGDLNGDGMRNALDIQGFVDCLTGGVNCNCGDVNGVGGATIADTSTLVSNLLAGTPCP